MSEPQAAVGAFANDGHGRAGMIHIPHALTQGLVRIPRLMRRGNRIPVVDGRRQVGDGSHVDRGRQRVHGGLEGRFDRARSCRGTSRAKDLRPRRDHQAELPDHAEFVLQDDVRLLVLGNGDHVPTVPQVVVDRGVGDGRPCASALIQGLREAGDLQGL